MYLKINKLFFSLSMLFLISSHYSQVPSKIDCPGGMPTGLYFHSKTNLLYAGCWGGIWEYNITNNSWREVDADPDSNILANAKIMEMHIDSKGVFYAGCDANTQSYVSYDGGKKWKQIESIHFTLQNVYCIYEHPNGSVYFGTNGGIIKTSDNGHTWTKLSNSPSSVNCIFGNSKGEIFVGTSTGLFRGSIDESVWIRVSLPGLIKPVLCTSRDSQGNFFLGIQGGLLRSTNDGISWVFLENDGNWTPAKLAVANNDILYGVYGYRGSFLGYFDENILSWTAFSVGIFKDPYYSTLAHGSDGVIFGLSGTHGLLKIILNTSSVLGDDIISSSFFLFQNYPNPFNPSTTIKYSIPQFEKNNTLSSQKVSIKIYDVLGRKVSTLVDEYQSPGVYTETFNGTDQPSGIYFCRLTAGGFSQTRKMVLLR